LASNFVAKLFGWISCRSGSYQVLDVKTLSMEDENLQVSSDTIAGNVKYSDNETKSGCGCARPRSEGRGRDFEFTCVYEHCTGVSLAL
jgi:hypothetical protein